ncbi:PTS sugar transporter subunit IIA [Terribium terrae]|uniref:PTS sugar transporter subunit IIA n=1 Tax=Terribium terrae TaxID=2725666 RepID=UPI00142F192A|nr:PTS sugar transporter subunit IIA [Mesorhizobium terrae]
MNIPLSRMQRDDAFANIVSVRDFNDRGSRDPYAGFASRAGTGDFLDFGAVDDPKAFSGQGFGEATPYRTNIVAFLAEQNVVLGLPANDKRSTLVRLAARLGDQAGLSRGAVLAAMLRRERLGSTAIGHGVAIPHARLEGISQPQAVLATLRRPVWFDAPDERPVDLLLAILWPKVDSAGFLRALAHVSRLLRDEGLRESLRLTKTPAEALACIEVFEEKIVHPSDGDDPTSSEPASDLRASCRLASGHRAKRPSIKNWPTVDSDHAQSPDLRCSGHLRGGSFSSGLGCR